MTEYWVKYITFDQIEEYRAQGWEIREYERGSYAWQFGVMAKKEIPAEEDVRKMAGRAGRC